MSIVTLLTDYGSADGYVGEVKGALLKAAPKLTLVDITHEVAPGDVAAAAYILARTWRAFPQGTVHLAVVDPGVGTSRRAIALGASGQFFVAPDNGLLSSVAGPAVALKVSPSAAATFHGRDVFAGAAAQLALGTPLSSLGTPIDDLVCLEAPVLRRTGKRLLGSVIHVDRFGTLVTTLAPTDLPRTATGIAAEREIPLRATFGDVESGALVAFIGSGGTLEIAVRDGRADQTLGLGRGDEVAVLAS